MYVASSNVDVCYNCDETFCTPMMYGVLQTTFQTTHYFNNAWCTKKITMVDATNVHSVVIEVDARRMADEYDFAALAWCKSGQMYCNQVNDDPSQQAYVIAGGTVRTYTVINGESKILRNVQAFKLALVSDATTCSACFNSNTCFDQIQRTFFGIRVAYTVNCVAGYTRWIGSGVCEACPAGTFTASPGSTGDCVRCRPGEYNPYAGRSTCLACPAGKYSDFYGATECRSCSPGTYASIQGNSVCERCPANRYNPLEASTSESACRFCELGKHTDNRMGASACMLCPAGKYQDVSPDIPASVRIDRSCKMCAVGKASAVEGAASAGQCLPCGQGYFSTRDGTQCVPCMLGTYLPSNPEAAATACLQCGAGFYAEYPASSNCSACEAGTFGNSTGLSTCFSCSAGTFSAVPGSAACSRCIAGTYSYPGSSTCFQCAAGTHSNRTGATKVEDCLACPPGRYAASDGMTACAACVAGTYNGTAGASMCSTCGLGRYALLSGTGCLDCPRGKYFDMVGERNTQCTNCPAGTASSTLGASSSDACVPCDQGNQYSNADGLTACLRCATDFPVTDAGRKSCGPLRCPEGQVPRYVLPDPSYPDITTGCSRCLAGTAEFVSNGTCSACPDGKYQDDYGQTVCKSCPYAGQYSILPRNYVRNCLCPAGTFAFDIKPDGITVTGRICKTCFDCSLRQAGTYFTAKCDPEQDRGAAIGCWTNCGVGQYISSPCSCESNVVCSNCTRCPAGKYVRKACDGVANTDCPLCSPGNFSSLEHQPSCSRCAPGYFSSTSGAQFCQACPAGTSSVLPGSTSCIPCAAGTHAPNPGSAQCTPCPAGQFSSATGATTCSSCARGFNQSKQQSTSCQPCPAGTFAAAEATLLCTACGAGTYAPPSTASSTCLACPPGTRESLAGSRACKNCTAGSFSSDAGRTTATCPACAPGYFSAQPGTITCTACPPGTFAPQSSSTACTACAAGNFTDQPGSTQCRVCPAGTFSGSSSIAGTSRCTPCAAGSFSARAGSTACTACQDGVTFANVSGSSRCTACSPACINGTEEQLRPCNISWDRLCARCSTKACTMVARSFRESATVTYDAAVVADILIVGGGSAGYANFQGGNPGTLILQFGYTLLPGTYLVDVGQGGSNAARGGAGGDTSFRFLGPTGGEATLFLARGGGSSSSNAGNVVNGIGGIGPTLSSSYVVLENKGEAAGGVQQIAGVPDRDLPFSLCKEMGVACGSGVEMVAPGRDFGDSAAIPNTGSGGNGGSYGGPGGSGIVVIRLLSANASSTAIAGCMASCSDMTVNSVFVASQQQQLQGSIPFAYDTLVDLLLVSGGGSFVFYKGFLMRAGAYSYSVGATTTTETTSSLGNELFVVRGKTVVIAGGTTLVNTSSSSSNASSVAVVGYSYYAAASSGNNNLTSIALKAGETLNLCSHLGLTAAQCTATAAGSSLIAIKNAVSDLPALCYGMCLLRGSSSSSRFCGPGTFFSGNNTCLPCPKNSYRDLSMQDARQQCTPCLPGYVTAEGGAASALACKNWCLAARKELGLVTVDTFPKVAVNNLSSSALVKV